MTGLMNAATTACRTVYTPEGMQGIRVSRKRPPELARRVIKLQSCQIKESILLALRRSDAHRGSIRIAPLCSRDQIEEVMRNGTQE